MFRPMRRKKKEISIEASKRLLQTARRGILAVNGDNGYPYAVPINYLYSEDENRIFFHGARTGYKFELLKKDGRVCFTVYGNETVKDEDWAPYVQSVVVFGKCRLTESGEHTTELVKRFAGKYFPDEESINAEVVSAGKAVQMFEIEIEHMSGKEIQER